MIRSVIKLNYNNIDIGVSTAKRYYVKRLVSKRVYNELKREKIDWETIRSSEILERLTHAPQINLHGDIRPQISTLIDDVNVLTSPNTERPIDPMDQEEAFEAASSDLMDMINRVKYDAAEEKMLRQKEKDEAEEQKKLMRQGKLKAGTLSARAIARKMLNRAPGRGKMTLTEMVEEQLTTPKNELLAKYTDDVPENIVDLETVTKKIIQVRKKIEEIRANEEQEDGEEDENDGGDVVVSSQDLEDLEEIKYRLYKQREYLLSAQDVDPRLKKTRTSRFFYQPGENSPLFDFAKLKLEEINSMELQEIERQKNVLEYAKLLREKSKDQLSQQFENLDSDKLN